MHAVATKQEKNSSTSKKHKQFDIPIFFSVIYASVGSMMLWQSRRRLSKCLNKMCKILFKINVGVLILTVFNND